MDEHDRQPQRGQAAVEEVVMRLGGCGRQSQPRLAVELEHVSPAPTMILGEDGCDLRSEAVGISGHLLKELSGTGFVPVEVKGFEDESRNSVWPFDPGERSDDGAVTVPPPNSLVDSESIQEEERLQHRSPMKIDWE